MTGNVSSEECESDEERTEGPPPAKKLKQKTLQFSRLTVGSSPARDSALAVVG